MLFSSRKLEFNSFKTASLDCSPVFVVVLFRLSVQLRLGDFVGFQISATEALAICCFSASQTDDGFHDVTKGKSQPGLFVNLHSHEDFIPALHEEIP